MKRLFLGSVAAVAVMAVAAAQQPPPRPATQRPARTIAPQTQPVAPPARPAANTPPTPVDPPSAPPGRYVGVASCVNSGCHGSTEPLNATRALQNEYYTWLNNDRHAQAYNILFNERSARIARNMKLRGKAYEETLCLDCHTTNVPASQIAGAIDKEDGVQCETCHGPASGWRNEHTQVGWKHEDSVARGMIDLRSVSRRGQQCLTCHLGNSRKEVDHELIASGHPLLTFELDNYEESMPPHWVPGGENFGLRAWSVGQVVKFRESLDNVARHARGQKWPEFSDMSCFNCHHDLKNSTWRQERGWPDRAGLPTWSPQHWAVLRLIIDRVSPADRAELDPLVRNLALAVARMNDRESVSANAEAARRIVDRLMARVEGKTWTDQDARAMMNTIVNDREFILASDVQAAEQAALSLQSLSSTMTRRDRRLLRSNLTRSIDALFEELQNRDDYNPARFVEKLNAVKAAL